MESLLEQEQGGVFLPSQVFRGGELNTIPFNHKTALFDKFIQGRLAIEIEMPMELFVDGLHVTRPDEGPIETLAGAQRVFFRQILPAEAAGQFPQNAFQEEAIGGQLHAAAVFSGGVDLNLTRFFRHKVKGIE